MILLKWINKTNRKIIANYFQHNVILASRAASQAIGKYPHQPPMTVHAPLKKKNCTINAMGFQLFPHPHWPHGTCINEKRHRHVQRHSEVQRTCGGNRCPDSMPTAPTSVHRDAYSMRTMHEEYWNLTCVQIKIVIIIYTNYLIKSN